MEVCLLRFGQNDGLPNRNLMKILVKGNLVVLSTKGPQVFVVWVEWNVNRFVPIHSDNQPLNVDCSLVHSRDGHLHLQ